MRKIIYTFLLVTLTSFCVSAQSLSKPKSPEKNIETKQIEREKFDPTRNPAEDLKNAIAKAEKENKRIVLDVGGEWCGWCVWMDKFFIANPDLNKLRDENFIWLKVNMSPENENAVFLSQYPAVTGYPHLYILEKDGKFLHSQPTEVLEFGKSYDLQKFTEFLKMWSPKKESEEAVK